MLLEHYISLFDNKNQEHIFGTVNLKCFPHLILNDVISNIQYICRKDHSNIELDDFPENLIQSELKTMVDNAKSHKYFRQYEKSDMDKFQEKDIDEETEKYKNRWTVLKTILRGISR